MMPITMADVIMWKKQEQNQKEADRRWLKDTHHYIQGLFERICPGQVEVDIGGILLAGKVKVWTSAENLHVESAKGGHVMYDRSPDGDRNLQERLLSELADCIP